MVPHQLNAFVADLAYHDAYSLNPKLQFQEFIAKNVAMRRCRGSFILTTNTDVYLGRHVLDQLEKQQLEPGVVYRAPRIDLKDEVDCDPMVWEVLEDEQNYIEINAIKPPCYTNASGDFILLDRDSYFAVRGFNEVYRVSKVHMDSNFCLKAYSYGLTFHPYDGPVYHVGSGTLNSQRPLYAARPADAAWPSRADAGARRARARGSRAAVAPTAPAGSTWGSRRSRRPVARGTRAHRSRGTRRGSFLRCCLGGAGRSLAANAPATVLGA